MDANNVLVKVEDDAVRLQEDVPTYSAMVTAENIAHRVWGVSTVKNELGGLKLLRNNSIEEVFQIVNPDFDWKKIMNLFQNMEVTDNYQLKWKSPDEEGIKTVLIDIHDFSKKTVKNKLDELVHLNSI